MGSAVLSPAGGGLEISNKFSRTIPKLQFPVLFGRRHDCTCDMKEMKVCGVDIPFGSSLNHICFEVGPIDITEPGTVPGMVFIGYLILISDQLFFLMILR